MGFSSYFLIAWDFIRHARERNIRTGPGRGSVAGSAVAYSLGITELDPIKYDLLFERFHNKQKKSFPDMLKKPVRAGVELWKKSVARLDEIPDARTCSTPLRTVPDTKWL
jgi:DNA polymerase III alpha subunit (gram-positive type)